MQETIRTLLQDCETWAVVGCSPDARRDSHRIAALLQSRGKRVIAVNPTAGEILGERAYASLHDLPPGTSVDVVDIFRRSEHAGAHVDEAIAIGARAVWMQLGVVDRAAAARAVEAGLLVVMDRCPAIEWRRLDASHHVTMASERTDAEIAAWKAGEAERNERARRERLRRDGARSPSENLAEGIELIRFAHSFAEAAARADE